MRRLACSLLALHSVACLHPLTLLLPSAAITGGFYFASAASAFAPAQYRSVAPTLRRGDPRRANASALRAVVSDPPRPSYSPSSSSSSPLFSDAGSNGGYGRKRRHYSDPERMRYQLANLRRDLELSEMRAAAAERRNRELLLQRRRSAEAALDDERMGGGGAGGRTALDVAAGRDPLRGDVESVQRGADDSPAVENIRKEMKERLKKKFDKQVEKLTARVRKYGEELRAYKVEHEEEMALFRSKAEKERVMLGDELKVLRAELHNATCHVQREIEKSDRLRRELLKTRAAKKEADRSLAAQKDEFIIELDKVQMEMSQRLSSQEMRFQERLDKQRLDSNQAVAYRDKMIQQYESERTSMRRLLPLVLALIKSRVLGIFRRKIAT